MAARRRSACSPCHHRAFPWPRPGRRPVTVVVRLRPVDCMGKPPYGEAPTVASSIQNRLWDQYRTACNVPSGGVADFTLHLVRLACRKDSSSYMSSRVIPACATSANLAPVQVISLPIWVFAIALRSESPPVLVHENEHGHCPQLHRRISSERSTGANRVM